MPIDEFKAEYGDIDPVSFSSEDGFEQYASSWIDDKSVLLASYWEASADPASKRGKKRIIRQYITNGQKILKKGPTQPGPYIPIIPTFGKELWVDYGGGAERVLLSLVSLARDPQKALAYVMSSMLENVGQLPAD
jgi:hypothetical protein